MEKTTPVDDRLSAAVAVRRAQRGESLLYQGDWRNALQLLGAMRRRLRGGRRPEAKTPLAAWQAERASTERAHSIVSRLVVALDGEYRPALARAPDVRGACDRAWGPAKREGMQVPLELLLGVVGAFEWYRRGIEVPGLKGKIHPHYGVFFPTRHEYAELLGQVPDPTGARVFDLGTGTGVLAFLLLQRGAAHAVGTDLEPRAVACARDNAERLGLSSRFEAQERPLFPEGQADVVLCNPPWIPEQPKSLLDAAVFDPDSRFLRGFVEGLAAHIAPRGVGYLLLSNLAELIGLRAPDFLASLFQRCGLRVAWTKSAAAKHPRAKDAEDALHAVRRREVTTLYALAPEGETRVARVQN